MSEPITNFTMAGDPYKALACRLAYEYERRQIAMRRFFRTATCRCVAKKENVRKGYPTKRERDDNIPSHRGVAFSNFTNQFKTVGDKIFVLHATRGWKHYA